MLGHSAVGGKKGVGGAVMWRYKGHRHGRRTCARVMWEYILNPGVKSINHLTGEGLDPLGTLLLEEKCWAHLQLQSVTTWLLPDKITEKGVVEKPASATLKLSKEHTQSTFNYLKWASTTATFIKSD